MVTLRWASCHDTVAVEHESEFLMPNTPHHYSRLGRFVRMLSTDSAFYVLLVPLTLALASVLFVFAIGSTALVVNKEPLVTSITKAISNGADLTVVRHLYKQRKVERPLRLVSLFIRSQETYRSDEYYAADTPLSDILQDIRAARFIDKPTEAQSPQAPLERIIREHEQQNPFDKLESGQREAFDNIRGKLGSNYDAVQNDLTRIGDELHAKNIAVEKYLRDSSFSLNLSIFALVITLIISSYQIFHSREKRLVEVLRKAFPGQAEPLPSPSPEA